MKLGILQIFFGVIILIMTGIMAPAFSWGYSFNWGYVITGVIIAGVSFNNGIKRLRNHTRAR